MKGLRIIALILAASFILSGCMNNRHLKDLAIVEGLAIDAQDSYLSVVAQVLNPYYGEDKSSGNMTKNVSSHGSTIQEAISNMSGGLSKQIFFGQSKLVIFGEEAAKEQILSKVDFFLHSTEARPDIALCVARGKASDIIKSTENDAPVPCENMLNLISNSEKIGLSVLVDVNDLLNLYEDATSDIYLPVISRKDERANCKADGIALFSDGKLAHITNGDNTMGFAILNGKVFDLMLTVKDDRLGEIGVKLMDFKVKKSALYQQGIVNFNVDLSANMMINEVEHGLDTSLNKSDYERLKQLTEARLRDLISGIYYCCTAVDADCLRVGEYLSCNDEAAYSSLKNQWKSYFKRSKLNTKAQLKIIKISDNTR